MADGDCVMSRFARTGARASPCLAPTGRHTDIQGVDLAAIRGGRIIEYFSHDGTLGVFPEVGAFPADMTEAVGAATAHQAATSA